MEFTQNLLVAKTLNLDIHPNLIKENELRYLLNGDIQDNTNAGHGVFVQNALSNELCVKQPPNYVFKGSTKLDKGQHVLYYNTGVSSEIGLFDENTCGYAVIANDPCLNFQNTVHGVYNYVQGERVIYFTDNLNPARYLNIDACIPLERTSECRDCEETYSNRLDCDRLNLIQNIPIPCIILEETNGNLPDGVYQVAIAFTSNGQRYSDYYIFPQLLKFHSNYQHRFGIKVSLGCLDTDINEYELVLITTKSDRGTVAQRVGIFNTSQTDVVINDIDETRYVPIDLSVLLSTRIYFKNADFIASNDNKLVLGKLTVEEEVNYQPEALKILSEWVEYKVPAKDAYKYKSFMRDEVYPIAIRGVYATGERTCWYHVPPNSNYTVATVDIRNVNAPTNNDHWEGSDLCDPDPLKYWEVYNTATVTSTFPVTCTDCTNAISKVGKFAYWESQIDYPDNDQFDTLRCTPIQYHKFPDNCITHIHDADECEENKCVNILGIRLSNIQPFKNKAGDIITSIVGYEIGVADRTNHKSVLHKGLIYNVWEETLTDGTLAYYANYPFNDLQPDTFLSSTKVKEGSLLDNYNAVTSYTQNKFTYHSPDTHFIKGQTGSELRLYTEEIGRVEGWYHYTDDYPKYQLLSNFARAVSQFAGLIEAQIALKGENCVETTREHRCWKKVVREKEQDAYTVESEASGSAPYGNVTGTFTLGTGTIMTQEASGSWDGTGSSDVPMIKARELADEDCEDVYTASNIVIETYTDPILPGVPFLDGERTCKITFDVTPNPTSPVVASITLSSKTYSSPVKEDGKCEIDLGNDCYCFPCGDYWTTGTLPDITFSPKCECTGDTEDASITTTHECDTKWKLIQNTELLERLPVLLHYYSQGVKTVQALIKAIISPKNYALQYTAYSDYSSYTCGSITQGNSRRRLDFQQHLLPIKQYVNNKKFNNWNRASAEYYELNTNIDNTVTTDNTKKAISDIPGCQPYFTFCSNDDDSNRIEAASYYAGVKTYQPEQYGQVDNFIIQNQACMQKIDVELPTYTSEVILGGDIYITKFSVTRKMPFFSQLPLGLPNNTEFDLSEYYNVWNPRWWMDVNDDNLIEDIFKSISVGTLFGANEFSFDEVNNLKGECILLSTGFLETDILNFFTGLAAGNYIDPFSLNGKFYTFATGVIDFWCESEFISDFREINSTTSHFPLQEPVELAKSKFQPYDNQYLYNLQYLSKGLSDLYTQCDIRRDFCKNNNQQYTHTAIFSNKHDVESGGNSWLNFRPNNYITFDKRDGDFTNIFGVDNYNLMFSFEDAMYITQSDDGLLTQAGSEIYLGEGDIFKRRLRKISNEHTGYGGCIDRDAMVNTPYGVYYPDRKRKKHFIFDNKLNDITGNLQSWFNNFHNGSTIAIFDMFSQNIYVTDKETNWTLSFKPNLKGWVSWHSFIPDYYVSMNNNFISVESNKTNSLWKHNKAKHYQTYYGKLEPFTIGITQSDKFRQTVLQSMEVYAEFIREIGYQEYIWTKEFFNKIGVYNQNSSSGILNVILKNTSNPLHHLIQNSQEQLIEADLLEYNLYRLNGFKNKAKSQATYRLASNGWEFSLPFTESDSNQLNDGLIRGRWFNTYLTYDKSSDYKILTELNLNITDEVKQ